MKRYSVWMAILIFSLLIVGCVAAAPAGEMMEDEGPKVLVVGTSQEPENVFVMWGSTRTGSDVMSFMWRKPISFGGDNQPFAEILESLPSQADGTWVVDEEAGTMQVTYKFRQGLKWSDGEEITVHDLAMAFEITSDPNYIYYSESFPVESIEIVDDYTAILHYKGINLFPDQEVRTHVIPEHVYRPLWEEAKAKGGNVWENFGNNEQVAINPVVNGPFMAAEWVPGSHIRLVRNPHFNVGEEPSIDEVLYRIIPDLNSLAVSVASGQVHLTDGWLSLEQANAMESAPEVDPIFVPALWLEHATIQVNRPPLSDKLVRQAVLTAIDRDGINEALFKGQQPPAHSWINSAHPAYNPNVRQYNYDPDEALRLLAEAGYTPNADGQLADSDGNLLEIPIITISGDRTREQVSALVQAQWQEIGITTEVKPVSARLLFSETLFDPPNFEGIAIWRWVFNARVEPRGFWYPGESAAQLDQLFAEGNTWAENERNKELIDMIDAELDQEKRYALLQEQQAIWAEELPVLPIYWHVRVATVNTALEGYQPADQAMVGWNVETWELE